MQKKIIVALDYNSTRDALNFLDKIDPSLCRVKVGKEVFTSLGVSFIQELHRRNYEVFLDLKFHDIPNTVQNAVKSAAELGIWMVDIHASGGLTMMQQARKILEPFGKDAPILIAVTVLTSMSQQDLKEIGINRTPLEQVSLLANLANKAGIDGVVCSPQEALTLKQQLGNDFILVTPGIRPTTSALDDQTRVMTPEQAIKAGSDYLVIGRPITQSENPAELLLSINKSIANLG